jgi:mono/diheme cytochrome c family protein
MHPDSGRGFPCFIQRVFSGVTTMKFITLVIAMLLLNALHAFPASADSVATGLERGRFLVKFGGCNDCHTPGYSEIAGKMAEQDWLKGSSVGFQGPWGTSYPGNLRLDFASWSEQEWLVAARAQRMPPMPWFALAELPDDDLRAIYRYIRSLGASGQPAPAYVAPGGVVTTPYIVFTPQVDSKRVANK